MSEGPLKPSYRKRALTAAVVATIVSACTVVESYRVMPAVGPEQVVGRCRSEGGAYALSMTTWSFEIARYGDGPYVLQKINTVQHPDQRWVFCLDYLAATNASDTVSIGYSQADGKTGAGSRNSGLLAYVASFAVDKTGDIIRKAIRAIFVGLSQNPAFDPTRAGAAVAGAETVLGKFEVDPLDAEEMAAVNARLRDFGFCLVLDTYTFDTGTTSAESYCSNPQAVALAHPSPILKIARDQQWLRTDADRGGVLYRPRIPYSMSIYTKDDPRGPGPWLLRKITQVQLENLSPVVSLEISRTVFAQNKVGLEFDAGVLKNFCIARSSPVAGFIEIPLDVVYGLITLPSATIQAEISRATQTRELVIAQENLIAAQKQYTQFLLDKNQREFREQQKPSAAVINGTTGCSQTNSCQPAALVVPQDNLAFLRATGTDICATLTANLAAAGQ